MSSTHDETAAYFAHLYTQDSRGSFADFEIGNAYEDEQGYIHIETPLEIIILVPFQTHQMMNTAEVKQIRSVDKIAYRPDQPSQFNLIKPMRK